MSERERERVAAELRRMANTVEVAGTAWLKARDVRDLRTAAALLRAEPVGEPVAWIKSDDLLQMLAADHTVTALAFNADYQGRVPLYAHPSVSTEGGEPYACVRCGGPSYGSLCHDCFAGIERGALLPTGSLDDAEYDDAVLSLHDDHDAAGSAEPTVDFPLDSVVLPDGTLEWSEEDGLAPSSVKVTESVELAEARIIGALECALRDARALLAALRTKGEKS